MTTQEPSAPATKQDIDMLMERMGKLYDAMERWKDELVETMEEKKEESVRTMKRYYNVAVENIHHEMPHANREESEVPKDRSKDYGIQISKLEAAAGLSV